MFFPTQKIITALVVIAFVAITVGSFVSPVQAVTLGTDSFGLNIYEGEETISGRQSINELVADIIQLVLSFAGAVAVGFIIYGGYLYIASAGDEKKREAAKNILMYAVIGLVIIIVAYIIVYAVVSVIGQEY